MLTIRLSRDGDLERLFDIWQSSVRATHDFLSASDFREIGSIVRNSYLPTANFLLAVDDGNVPHGFLGAADNCIDALFVHGNSLGRGVGGVLMRHFLTGREEVTVSVNEQNVQARAFYEHMGFKPYSRSSNDEDGRPYPLIKMRWKKTEPSSC